MVELTVLIWNSSSQLKNNDCVCIWGKTMPLSWKNCMSCRVVSCYSVLCCAMRCADNDGGGGGSGGCDGRTELSGNKPNTLIIKHHKLWTNAIFAGRQINYDKKQPEPLAFSHLPQWLHLFLFFRWGAFAYHSFISNHFQWVNIKKVFDYR